MFRRPPPPADFPSGDQAGWTNGNSITDVGTANPNIAGTSYVSVSGRTISASTRIGSIAKEERGSWYSGGLAVRCGTNDFDSTTAGFAVENGSRSRNFQFEAPCGDSPFSVLIRDMDLKVVSIYYSPGHPRRTVLDPHRPSTGVILAVGECQSSNGTRRVIQNRSRVAGVEAGSSEAIPALTCPDGETLQSGGVYYHPDDGGDVLTIAKWPSPISVSSDPGPTNGAGDSATACRNPADLVTSGACHLIERSGYRWASGASDLSQARAVYTRCLAVASASQCDSLPIYVPGSEVSTVAAHAANAIRAGKPSVLTYASDAEQRAAGRPRAWYKLGANLPNACGTDSPENLHCDEYPYYSTAQMQATVESTDLQLLDRTENVKEGAFRRWFYRICNISDAPSGSPNRNFIVVPGVTDPSNNEPMPTVGICRKDL